MPDLGSLVWTDPERMGGAPCFVGTRVPVHSLFDYLAGGESLDEFLDSFPTVGRSQAEGLLMPEVLAALPALQPGVVHSIGTWRGKDDVRDQ